MSALQILVATTKRLAETDPHDEAVKQIVTDLQEQAKQLGEQAREDTKGSWGEKSMKDDIAFIGDQISKLKSAAEIPLKNYQRIVKILEGIETIHKLATRPQNATVRPHVAVIVKKIAGVFAEVDTTADLDKPLEQIEKAVAAVYKDQSKHSTYYFERRNLKSHPRRYDYDK
jgi:hypothetical protein